MIIELIRSERRKQGLTLEQLAAHTGIAASNLSRLEQGRVDPRLSTIERVVRGLGLEIVLVPVRTARLADIRDRMAQGAARLKAAGLAERDAHARLAHKEARGLDTWVERRVIGAADGSR